MHGLTKPSFVMQNTELYGGVGENLTEVFDQATMFDE